MWRRYRLTPVSTALLVSSTVTARYCILITAGLLQLGLALGVGMPLPRHPFDLFVVFTFVSFAFIGLGLVMAMMADNVPAVQALGQCIFLPMLIIGGIAVPLASLPDWAQHASTFFPGRYAVEALQACVVGNGLGATRIRSARAGHHWRGRLRCRREDVPLGRAAALLGTIGQSVGERRPPVVGHRRRAVGVSRPDRGPAGARRAGPAASCGG